MTTLKQSAWSDKKTFEESTNFADEGLYSLADNLEDANIGSILTKTIPQPGDDFRQTLARRLLVVLEDQTNLPEMTSPQSQSQTNWWAQLWKNLTSASPQARLSLATAILILILSLAFLTTVSPMPWDAVLHQVMGITDRFDAIATARTLASATPTATNTPPLSTSFFEAGILETVVVAQPVALAIPGPPAIATPARYSSP